MIKQSLFLGGLIFFCLANISCAQEWTMEEAREEAFKNVKMQIDVSQYSVMDKNFEENQKALMEGRTRIGTRFITPSSEPPIGYIVSEIASGEIEEIPVITTFYSIEGLPLAVRLFSDTKYPRSGYVYCVNNFITTDGKARKAGELQSIHFQISQDEAIYFSPNGECTWRGKY